MNISFSTLACPDASWSEILAGANRYGYDGVEVRLLERETDLLKRPEFNASQLETRRRELRDSGVVVSGLASSVRFDHTDATERERDLATGRQYLDLAAELGAGFVRVFGDVVPAPDDAGRADAISHIVDGWQSLGEYAETLDKTVVVETHGDYSDSALVVETLSRVESSAVGVLWDTHHPWRFCGEDLAMTCERLKPWIRCTHWKDSISQSRVAGGDEAVHAASTAHALMSGHQHADYVLFGGGEFPIVDCLRLLAAIDFDGWYCYEWEKAWHPEIESPEIALPLFPGKLRGLASLAQSPR